MREVNDSGRQIQSGLPALPGRRYVLEAAAAWRLSPAVVLLIFALPVLIIGFGLLTALLGKESYKWFTGEDALAENLQVAFYLFSFLLAVVHARRQWQRGLRLVAVLYAGLGLGLFFLVGEEISWGQRIFGWETSEAMAAINKQGENTIHNISGIASAFKWVQFLVGAYGTLLPLVVLSGRVPRAFRPLAAAVIPHYSQITYFAFLFVWRIYRNLFDAPDDYSFAISEFNEVLELILALGLFLFLVYQLRQVERSNHLSEAQVQP